MVTGGRVGLIPEVAGPYPRHAHTHLLTSVCGIIGRAAIKLTAQARGVTSEPHAQTGGAEANTRTTRVLTEDPKDRYYCFAVSILGARTHETVE